MANLPRSLRRVLRSDVATSPVRVTSFPSEITNVKAPSHPDPDMQEHIVPIDQDPSTYIRQVDSYTRGNDTLLDYNDFSAAGSPSVWSLNKGAVLSSSGDPLYGKTKSFECHRCGELKPSSKSKLEWMPGIKALKRVCVPTCKDWNTEELESGARRGY